MALCDTDHDKAERLALTVGQPAVFNSLASLLAAGCSADVMVICTPNGLHAEQSIACLNAGFHVLCEKPMALHLADCEAMAAVAARNGKQLFVVKQNRFNPVVIAAKDLLDKYAFGDIYSVQLNCFWNRDADYYAGSWRGTMDMDGGTLFTQFSHFIDILYWFMGDVKSIKGILSNHAHKGVIEFEDTGMVVLEFQNGATGTINYTVNAHKKNMEGSLVLFGSKGTIKIGGEYLNRIEYSELDIGLVIHESAPSQANHYGSYTGSMSNHDKVYRNLVNYFEGKESLNMNMADSMKTVGIIERIYMESDYSQPEIRRKRFQTAD